MKINITAISIIVLAKSLICSGIILALIQLNPVLYPQIGNSTSFYDCDDGTLDMYRHFEKLGISSMPVIGNLEMIGESYTQSNHVWLLVRFGNQLIAYDWGTPRFDRQHYEGYRINLDYLLYVVQQDFKNPELLPIAKN